MNELPIIPKRFCVGLILLVGALAHGLSLGADFYMDDGVVMSEQMLAWDGTWRNHTLRLLPGFLAAVVNQLFGASPIAHHALNLTLHLGLAVMVFWGARVFLEAGKVFKDRALLQRAAFFAALIFSCHPICSEAVNYARCTRIQLVSIFSLLAAIGTLRFCQRPSWRAGLGTAAVVILAGISKDPGFVHAVGNVMIVVLVFANWSRVTSKLRRPIDWAIAGLGVAAFFWIGLHGFTTWWIDRAVGMMTSGIDFFQHGLTQGRVFWGYAQRVALPVNLSADHYIPMTHSVADWQAVLMTLGVIALAVGSTWMMFCKRLRFFGALAMLALAPLLLRFFYPISEFMVEYRVYPAMPWIALLAGIGIAVLYQKNSQVMKFAVLFLVVAGVVGSALRSAVWQDAESIARNVIEQYPENNRARNEIQRLAIERRDFATVFEMYPEVLEAAEAQIDYGRMSKDTGRAYLTHAINEWVLLSEARVALGVAETLGSKKALAHIDSAMARFQSQFPEYFDSEHRYFKYGKPLVELREMVVKVGAIQDERIGVQASNRDVAEP